MDMNLQYICTYFKFLDTNYKLQKQTPPSLFISVRPREWRYKGVPSKHFFLFRFEPKLTETLNCYGDVSVCFLKLENFCFWSWTDSKWNQDSPKWRSTKQKKTNQSGTKWTNSSKNEKVGGTVGGIVFLIMYFGLQEAKPPPCPLRLTKRGGSIH